MKLHHLILCAAVGCALSGFASASDAYRNPAEYRYPANYNYGHTYESHDHHCGTVLLPGWKWSDWYQVDTEGKVDLQVRYRMKNVPRGTRTFMQLRYVNNSKCIKTATVSNVRLHFHDGSPDLIWSGESVTVQPYSVGYGKIQTLNGRLCTWNKHYAVH